MRARALAGLVLLLAAPASAEPRRGWLTVAGLSAGGAGLAGLAAGLALTIRAGGADAALAAYYAPGSGPHLEEASYVLQLGERARSDHRFGSSFLAAGGVLLALGVTALILDGRLERAPELTLVPTSAGLSLSCRWGW